MNFRRSFRKALRRNLAELSDKLYSALGVTKEPIWRSVRGRETFLKTVKHGSVVLDVGCGNNSPAYFKALRPDIYYIGLDVGDYNQHDDPRTVSDEYFLVDSSEFASTIEKMKNRIDVVVCTHNIEHCEEPERVLVAMARALRVGGRIYLSFPCEASVKFPSRRGTLNFFDDKTHTVVPNWRKTLRTLNAEGCKFEFKAKRYRPLPQFITGMLGEHESKKMKQVIEDGSTWAYYGFESVIWAYKPTHE